MATTFTAPTGSGARVRVQKFGTFLSNMIMPNIPALIAWGLAAMGYVANQAQTDGSRMGIVLLLTVIPGAVARRPVFHSV